MYSMPVIVAPAAAVGTGSCQTRVRLREVSGLEAAKASATSAAVAVVGDDDAVAAHRRAPPGAPRAAPRRLAAPAG